MQRLSDIHSGANRHKKSPMDRNKNPDKGSVQYNLSSKTVRTLNNIKNNISVE